MVDPKHPRAVSLMTRDKIVKGVKGGLTSLHGLIAQGRGEAFDYLIGEQTQKFGVAAIKTSCALLLLAKYPVLSINGNDAALVSEDYIQLAKLLDCPIEVNLFHRSKKREIQIKRHLKKLGAKQIIGIGKEASVELKDIASKRRFVSPEGIQKADVVFVPLEDGDRTEALIKIGKKVITIDLNPLSRTAQKATITIVDNIVRALPLIISQIQILKKYQKQDLQKIIDLYDNKKILSSSLLLIRERIQTL